MKKGMIIKVLLLTAVLAACNPQPVTDNPGGDGQSQGLTDEMQFNSIILKSELEALPEGSVLEEAESGNFATTLTFSGGKTFIAGKRWSAFVSQDADDYITINGRKTEHRVVDFPWYTISPQGNWLKEGVDTGERAISVSPSAAAGGVCLLYLQDRPRGSTAWFSDGSSLSFPRPDPKYEMFVRKTTTQMDVYIGEEGGTEVIRYPFMKRFRAWEEGKYPAFYDNWGIRALQLCKRNGDDVTLDGTAIFLNGEAEMAIAVPDGRDQSTFCYVGGSLHGFENILTEAGKRQITISVDGRDIPEDGTFDLMKASRLVMTQRSELCLAYTNSDPFANAYRIWTFENGRLTVRVELTLLKDTAFNQAMFGMMCVLRRWEGDTSKPYLTRWAVKDNIPEKTIDVSDNWGSMSKDPKASRITEYGEMGYSFAPVLDGGTRK
jgi:hypothetical protein